MPWVKDHEEKAPPRRVKRNRRDQKTCPFCSEKLPPHGGRRMHICRKCNAQADKPEGLSCCKSARIWRCGTNYRCFTCGKEVVATP